MTISTLTDMHVWQTRGCVVSVCDFCFYTTEFLPQKNDPQHNVWNWLLFSSSYTSDVRLNGFITFKSKFAEAWIANCELARLKLFVLAHVSCVS